ncbi:SusD/RagB family nutrient-binding outer membrane lipoprotein [Gramella sp. AN32]|uniref:SusD/RagB family nutrient-binding outer membrane lipoprotein n=1 Tax=Christiangramia antarctica TaxID=2058158 RepID=A0ABW5X1T8_9FLAO|nr:SusD/RagB family nutrient-binding outer membrane lipoprotein [Gramella sp. AN32]MCM4157956.1 SusD/RagB family nutrient-binding outer membrane lipoprotein [Gramella sp. AN32]
MKNIKFIILGCGIFSLVLAGCTNDFEEINENPNSPENVDPQFLLANVISVEANMNTYDQGFRLANYLDQFAASVEFERIDRYEMGSNSGYWNNIFRLQTDIRSMKELPGSNEAYVAVGDILRSYLFSQLTDIWGDVPYTEAIQALDGNFTPKYDTQESIYTHPETGILKVLERSATTLENTNATIKGDVMFQNDLDKWVRFANSLRLRYLMRISKRLSNYSEIQELADSCKLIESNAQNAVVPYLSTAPNQWPMFLAGLGLYQEHRMTKTVDSLLRLWNDPRVEVLYKPTQKSVNEGNPHYKGLLNGQSRETISSKGINLNDISLFGAMFRDVPDAVNGQYMQYAEVQFALAEAAERGYISQDPGPYYKEGIKANFDYLDVEFPEDYLSREAIALGEDNLTKILTQKWLSLINNGHEAWFNVRRTGIPNLKPGPDNLNDGRYPVRYLYPESEQATNRKNYEEAAARIGGDNINSEGWWEM